MCACAMHRPCYLLMEMILLSKRADGTSAHAYILSQTFPVVFGMTHESGHKGVNNVTDGPNLFVSCIVLHLHCR